MMRVFESLSLFVTTCQLSGKSLDAIRLCMGWGVEQQTPRLFFEEL